MPYTNWTVDDDVSKFMHHLGFIEKGITQVSETFAMRHPRMPTEPMVLPQIFSALLNGSCVRPDGSRALVLDVGANFGYFSLYAAKLGCR